MHGVAVVARHEFRARLRTGRWRLLLGLWVAVVAAFTVLLRLALAAVDETRPYGLPLLLGAGSVWVTVRRLRTPARSLPRGACVA